MELSPLKRIYTRPKIEFRENTPYCICNECGGVICKANYDISKAKFLDKLFNTELPLVCKKCTNIGLLK